MLDAAKAMKLSANDLFELQIVDEIIKEPLGGAHRDRDATLNNVKKSIINNLQNFKNMSGDEIFAERKNKFLKIGRNKGFIENTESLSNLTPNNKDFNQIFIKKKNYYPSINIISCCNLINYNFIRHHNIFYIFSLNHKYKVHFYSFFFQYI